MSASGTRLEIAPAWRASLEARGLTTLDALFDICNDQRLAKPGLPPWRERIRHVLGEGESARVLFVKRTSRLPWGEQIRRWLAGDPNHGTAWVEWNWLNTLRAAGVAVPEPIAYGEDMLGPWERRSALAMGAVAGTSLERWCQTHAERLPPGVQHAVADLVRRVHALGICHRDLYLAHLFCADPCCSEPDVSLIDLQRARTLGWRGRGWIVKDLASLNYSTPDHAAGPRHRLRWLKHYLERRRLTRSDRLLARRIAAKTERIRRHDERRNRRLSGRPFEAGLA